jgi:serine O-acetyltransferase
MNLRELIKSDLARYEQTFALRGQPFSKTKIFWESFLFKAGFQAVFLYRLSRWFYDKGFIYIAWFFSRLNITLTGAEIEFNAEIGPGLFIAHPVGVVVGRGTKIGCGATFFQGVSFGVKSWKPEEIGRFPKAGDHCYFFAGSVVLGGVTIGDDCAVAANAVVSKDMPSGSLAKGVPAQIVPGEGKEMIRSWMEPRRTP